MTPDEVDTLPGPATVDFSVHATDAANEGVTGVGLVLSPATNDGTGPDFAPIDLQLTSGDATDGTWTGSIELPQGTPPETYYLQVWVQDPSHWRSYVSAGSPYAGDPDQTVLESDPKVIVIDNPAG